MRDFTEEELKLAQHDCDHYNIIDGNVYFTDVLGICVFDINGVEVDNCIMDSMVFAKSVPLPKKPFDITKHEFIESDIQLSEVFGGRIRLHLMSQDLPYVECSKTDVIAIAKALGVTGDDLK